MSLATWAHREAEGLLAVSLPRRWRHVRGVCARASVAGALFSAEDADLLMAAAVLHDIGYAAELASSRFHPLDGARYLIRTGAEQRLVDLVAHHSCARREAHLRGLDVELAEFTDEGTALRDALWWADMTTTPDGAVTTVDYRLAEIQGRYGPGEVVTVFVRSARAELVGAVERTEKRLQAAGIVYE